jgi:hypothetical protein
MGRTACIEPQCLYNGALYLYLTVELYLYSPYGPYGLYIASVPVQGWPLTLPYSTAIPLLPLWAVWPVQSLSACTRVHFTFTYNTPQEVEEIIGSFVKSFRTACRYMTPCRLLSVTELVDVFTTCFSKSKQFYLVPQKCRYLLTHPHGVVSQKTWFIINTPVRILNLENL